MWDCASKHEISLQFLSLDSIPSTKSVPQPTIWLNRARRLSNEFEALPWKTCNRLEMLRRRHSSQRHICFQYKARMLSINSTISNIRAGFYYFITHKALWRPLMSRLAPTITLSLGVTTLMFFVAYLPQAAIMAFTSGPIAAFSAALLTLSESSTIINLLSRTFLIEDALIDTFDGTLLSKECTNLVSSERQINASGDPIARLGKLMKKPFAKFTPNAIIRYVMYLPLNFIPIVGTVMFIFLQGKRNGPSAHSRYFQLKQWTKRQQDAFVEQNRGGYTS